jgi:uncharacterized RDD family membrane protein YckC
LAERIIQITTAQNVKLDYELASPMTRMASTLLDYLILSTTLGILSAFLGQLGVLWLWIAFFIGTFYHLIMEYFYKGRSIGKMILGLRVMKTNGELTEFSDYFNRWILRIVDITLSMGGIGLFFMYGTRDSQRLGDIMAGTTVVKKRNNLHFSLADIRNLHESTRSAEIKYPALRHIHEKHILFLKNLLNLENEYPSGVYREALREASDKMATLLELEKAPKNEKAFLTEVVQDYIAQTR